MARTPLFLPSLLSSTAYVAVDSLSSTMTIKLEWMGGAKVAQLVKHPTLDLSSGCDLRVVSSSPPLGSTLGVESLLKKKTKAGMDASREPLLGWSLFITDRIMCVCRNPNESGKCWNS